MYLSHPGTTKDKHHQLNQYPPYTSATMHSTKLGYAMKKKCTAASLAGVKPTAYLQEMYFLMVFSRNPSLSTSSDQVWLFYSRCHLRRRTQVRSAQTCLARGGCASKTRECSVLLSAGMTWGHNFPLRLAALCVILFRKTGYPVVLFP